MAVENQTITTTSISSQQSNSIELPLYYFENRGQPLRVTINDNINNSNTIEFPIEIVQQFLTSYGTWGDITKLASVQKGWSSIVSDAANTSGAAKWSLAQSLLHGTNGVQRNPIKALQLLKELASVSTTKATNDNNNLNTDNKGNVHDYVIPAMKQIAKLYLNGSNDTNSEDGEENDDDNNTSENDTTVNTTEKSSLSTIDDDENNNINNDILQDTTTGIEWLIKCHDIGNDADSAYDLALIYEYGQYNTTIDVVIAFEWFTKSALLGHVDSMTELALCYELGCGTIQNDTLALDWYMKAAELGHNTAKYSIGEAFEIGNRGVPQSDEEACLWYYKAAITGCIDSHHALQRLHDIARIVIPGVHALLLNV
jgi:TPR repeat protein